MYFILYAILIIMLMLEFIKLRAVCMPYEYTYMSNVANAIKVDNNDNNADDDVDDDDHDDVTEPKLILHTCTYIRRPQRRSKNSEQTLSLTFNSPTSLIEDVKQTLQREEERTKEIPAVLARELKAEHKQRPPVVKVASNGSLCSLDVYQMMTSRNAFSFIPDCVSFYLAAFSQNICVLS
uniref:Uncharacterized protein n=1 Tax=Glossina brevipalpis TaxID=37001 RepID=A0A1A9X510_9MUSC